MWQLAAQVAHTRPPRTHPKYRSLHFVRTLQAGLAWMPQALEWTQTALYKDGTTDLLKSMPPLVFMPMPDAPDGSPFLSIDASTSYQEILGFGGELSPRCSPASIAHLRLDSAPAPRLLACASVAAARIPASPASRRRLTHAHHR